ncbi:MAG TPA: ArgE/DapE family deacylase [Candidatus Omnitrophota bacterium]|nr:ArgE/DapE family deacylase [Candidatus Omnitrophota bacterium]
MINRPRLIQTLQKVVSYNSENPPGNELVLSRFIAQDMRSLGLDVKLYSFAKNRPNVIVTLKGTFEREKAQKQALLITPHIDTVPAGKGWKYHPLSGTISGGKIYGRGTSDDKGNLASCMEVMRGLVEDKIKLRKDVILAATVDEETGSHYGIKPLLDKKILRPKIALVLDSDEGDAIVAQKGLMHIRIQIFGKKAHGAYNWKGVNAIEIATKIITQLKQMAFKYKKHPLLRPPTVNIGTIKGGDKVNIVADFCEFSVDIRYLPGMNPRNILKEVKHIIRKYISKFKILVDDLQFPYEISAENSAVKLYVETIRKYGLKGKLKGSEGATVITFFQEHKIPAFASGFSASGTAHATDEFIRMNTLYKGTKALEAFIKEYDKK